MFYINERPWLRSNFFISPSALTTWSKDGSVGGGEQLSPPLYCCESCFSSYAHFWVIQSTNLKNSLSKFYLAHIFCLTMKYVTLWKLKILSFTVALISFITSDSCGTHHCTQNGHLFPTDANNTASFYCITFIYNIYSITPSEKNLHCQTLSAPNFIVTGLCSPVFFWKFLGLRQTLENQLLATLHFSNRITIRILLDLAHLVTHNFPLSLKHRHKLNVTVHLWSSSFSVLYCVLYIYIYIYIYIYLVCNVSFNCMLFYWLQDTACSLWVSPVYV